MKTADFLVVFLPGSGKTTAKNVEVSMCVIADNGRVIEVSKT